MATITGNVNITPSQTKVALPGSYITDFNFLNQYLPDTYEKEFERYGNRSVSSFLRLVGAELPCSSDLIKWSEQGRLHIKYEDVVISDNIAAADGSLELEIANAAIRKGQTVMISDGTSATVSAKGIVTSVSATKVAVALFDAAGVPAFTSLGGADNSGTNVDVFIYGSEFKKGTTGTSTKLLVLTWLKLDGLK